MNDPAVVKLAPGVRGEDISPTPALEKARKGGRVSRVVKKAKLSEEERKAKQREYSRAYWARKKAGKPARKGATPAAPGSSSSRVVDSAQLTLSGRKIEVAICENGAVVVSVGLVLS